MRFKVSEEQSLEIGKWIMKNNILKDGVRLLRHRANGIYELEFTDKPMSPTEFYINNKLGEQE